MTVVEVIGSPSKTDFAKPLKPKSTRARALEHLSISDRLLRLGYTHESTSGDGAHAVRTEAGELVGYMHAHEAVEFIHEIEQQQGAPRAAAE